MERLSEKTQKYCNRIDELYDKITEAPYSDLYKFCKDIYALQIEVGKNLEHLSEKDSSLLVKKLELAERIFENYKRFLATDIAIKEFRGMKK